MTKHKIKFYDEISDVEYSAPNLWSVSNCFSPSTLAWLQQIYQTTGNEFVAGDLAKRLQLKFGSHDYARLNEIGLNMQSAMCELFDQDLVFMEAKYWIDLPRFGCQSHSDAADLICSYQIYLESSNRLVKDFTTTEVSEYELLAEGAIFTHVDPPCQIAFSPNCGYINDNKDLKPHWVPSRWDTRVSVMFQYGRV